MRTTIATMLAALALALSGCGGGGGGSEQAVGGCTPTMANPDACAPTLQLTLTDSEGSDTTQVSPDSPGTVTASVKDGNGDPIPNVVVTFTTTDEEKVFVPASGTALTGVDGLAQVGMPAGPLAGAFTVSASASVDGRALISSVNYAVAFPALSLSALDIGPSPLSAGGNASVSVTVMSGGTPYTTPLSVSFASSCAAIGKATIDQQVTTRNGVATASYSDKACAAVDTVTASVTLGGTTVTQTGSLTVLAASAGSIKFVGADTPNIALKGTGGVGRQEFAVLTFQAFDDTGHPAVGKGVDFVFSYPPHGVSESVFGLKLSPEHATTNAEGKVTTTVFAGTIPTSVRVRPSISDAPDITTLSNLLVVSTGVPDQAHFSLSTQTGNCEGWNFDQLCSRVKAQLGDHFGNPVPDGTAVNFSVEGGFIGASCVTVAGVCEVDLLSSSPRPTDGRVTVLAYALGEENFFDANGDNAFNGSDTFTDKSPDIYRDDDENGAWAAGEACVGPNTSHDCATPGDEQYNGVLGIHPSPQTLYVSAQLVQTFSTSDADIAFGTGHLICPAGGTADFQVTVKDLNGNLMPAGTKISFSALFGVFSAPVIPNDIPVPNVVLGLDDRPLIPNYTATVGCGGGSGTLTVTVTTPNKRETYASIPIN